MRTSLWLFALTAVATDTACIKPVNTVPAPVTPTAQVPARRALRADPMEALRAD